MLFFYNKTGDNSSLNPPAGLWSEGFVEYFLNFIIITS